MAPLTGKAPDRLRWKIVTAPPGRPRFLGHKLD